MIKNRLTSGLMGMLILAMACEPTDVVEPTQPVAAFTLSTTEGDAPLTVTFTNTSTDASRYAWTFEGGDPETSTEAGPVAVTFSNPGTYTVTLVASDTAAQTSTATETVTVNRTSEIITYTDITMYGADGASNTDQGVYLDLDLGTVYAAPLDDATGAGIELVYVAVDGSFQFFASPSEDNSDLDIPVVPSGQTTLVVNDVYNRPELGFEVADFDAMTDDTPLLVIDMSTVDQNTTISPREELPQLILFQLEDGRKGALKITELETWSDGYITFDVKLQKYAQ